MKIIKKLKALFLKDDRPVSLDLAAAEIKEGRAYLHPKENPTITYRVKSDDIEVRLSKGKSLTDQDIVLIVKRKEPTKDSLKQKESESKQKTDRKAHSKSGAPSEPDYDMNRFKKRTFSVSLYPEEYDVLMEMIQKYGYKRAEFILASAQTATQGTMAKAQKKVLMARKEIRKEERELKVKAKQS